LSSKKGEFLKKLKITNTILENMDSWELDTYIQSIIDEARQDFPLNSGHIDWIKLLERKLKGAIIEGKEIRERVKVDPKILIEMYNWFVRWFCKYAEEG